MNSTLPPSEAERRSDESWAGDAGFGSVHGTDPEGTDGSPAFGEHARVALLLFDVLVVGIVAASILVFAW